MAKYFQRTLIFFDMKFYVGFVAAAVLFSANISAVAQEAWLTGNRLMIRGGINSPVGSFATLPSALADLVPQSGKAPVGAANLGFTAGIEDIFRFTPNLGLVLSLDACYNPYNNDEARRQLNASISNISLNGISLGSLSSLLGITSSYNAQAYINGTLLGGIRYDLPILAGVLSAYATAQGGLFYGVLPSSEAKIAIDVPFVNIKADAVVSQASAQASAFAYGIGAGLLIGDRVNIGARYVASSPEFSTDIKTTVNASGIPGTVAVPGLGQVNTQTFVNTVLGVVPQTSARFVFPTSSVQITVGVVF